MTDSVTPTPAAPAYAPAPVGQRTNVLAIVALILGILVPLGGIICGAIALGQIKRTGEAGRGLALAGLIIGIVLVAISIIVFIATFALAASVGTSN